MFKKFLKFGWRRINNNKIHSIINVSGLAIGICACLSIFLIARHELSFDRFHQDRDRIYQINTYEQNTQDDPISLSPAVLTDLPEAVKSDVPGILTVAPYYILFDGKTSLISGGQISSDFSSMPVIAGPEYFEIMKYEWLAGDVHTALSSPYQVVLTENKVQTYFGTRTFEQVIGRELIYNDSILVKVSGVVKDWKGNTDFPYTEFISISTVQNAYLKGLLQLETRKGIPYSSRVLVKLEKNVKPLSISNALSTMYNRKWQTQTRSGIYLQPLAAIHFAEYSNTEKISTTHLSTLYILGSIALFILILALINYINLSVAGSLERHKELAVRKIMGSSRLNLVFQLLTESFLMSFFASVLAILLVNPTIHTIRLFIPSLTQLSVLNFENVTFAGLMLVVTGLLAGLIPAKILSSVSPLPGQNISRVSKFDTGWFLKEALVIFQFAISLIFIICVIVISKQVTYLLNSDLGFDKKSVLIFETNDRKKVNILVEKFKHLPGVIDAARENMPPMGQDHGYFSISYSARNIDNLLVLAIKADENYLDLYGMHLIAGRNLFASDTVKEFIINESLAKSLGFNKPEEAIGEKLFSWNRFCPIVGVVTDFHQASFHETIKPLLITSGPCTGIAVKLDIKGATEGKSKDIIHKIETQWKEVFPDLPFEYVTFDDTISQLYQKEETTSRLIKISTVQMIFISCIGLFGLALFNTKKRTKEISIRKTLGATVGEIVVMLNKNIFVIMLTALLVATPIAWLLMHRWLEDFAYKISISWWIFLLAGGSALFIAISTVSIQSVQAALKNPIDGLRSE
jgi:putative ABC transport system permease protein